MRNIELIDRLILFSEFASYLKDFFCYNDNIIQYIKHKLITTKVEKENPS